MHNFSNVPYPSQKPFKHHLYRRYILSDTSKDIEQLKRSFGDTGYRAGWRWWTFFDSSSDYPIKYVVFAFEKESDVTLAKMLLPDCTYHIADANGT